ncbi:hypothetical protein ACFC0P_46240, partial [Streptomyces broussonetiae]|uniref:hypothetical protein n=1 Tax=Streptomyces broussonetiae TaxID=2686304 RepID=UPI0035E1FCA8
MSKASGDGHDLWPDGGLEILRVGVVGRLGRRGVKRGTELSHQDDLFVTSEADAEVPLWVVGVAEVVEECMEDMVQVFERRRVESHVPLPWWIGQGQHNGYDVDSVVRYESGGFAHESERSDRSGWRRRCSRSTALGVRSGVRGRGDADRLTSRVET